jgi:hypothetical protein
MSSVGTKLGFGKVGITTGTGVVTVNNSGGAGHLNTLRIAPTDPADSEGVPVTDPESSLTVQSNFVDQAHGLGGTLGPISGAATGGGAGQIGTLGLAGVARVCIFGSGCGLSLPLILTQNETRGVGLGGLVTVGGNGPLRISLVNSPWQIGTGTRLISTANGAVITRKWHGFVHGPASATSSTAKTSGMIQMITPIQVNIKGINGNAKQLSLFTSITTHFVPEPGLMLLLGSGVAGLALLGRSRMRK